MDTTLAPMALLAQALARLEPASYPGDMSSLAPVCPYGHPLVPGRILVGWAPCQCASALAGLRGRGHRTTQCLACADRNITSVRYEPEHLGGGHPGRSTTPGGVR